MDNTRGRTGARVVGHGKPIQFAHDAHGRSGSGAAQSRLHSRQRQPLQGPQAKVPQLLHHEVRGALFSEAQLGVAEDVLAELRQLVPRAIQGPGKRRLELCPSLDCRRCLNHAETHGTESEGGLAL
jgi:hypothetical protein